MTASARGRSPLVCAPMKRPSLKRSPKQPTPQELGAATQQPAAPGDPVFAPIADEAEEGEEAQEGEGPEEAGRVGGGLRRIGRLGQARFASSRASRGRARLDRLGRARGRRRRRGARSCAAGRRRRARPRGAGALREGDRATRTTRRSATSCSPRPTCARRRAAACRARSRCAPASRTSSNPTLEVAQRRGQRRPALPPACAAPPSAQVPAEDVYTLVREDDDWRIASLPRAGRALDAVAPRRSAPQQHVDRREREARSGRTISAVPRFGGAGELGDDRAARARTRRA